MPALINRLFLFAVGIFCVSGVSIPAQRAFEFSATVGLGYSEHASPSPIVRLNDETALIISPTSTLNHRDTLPRLMILRDVHHGGSWEQFFYPVFNPQNPGVIFNQPVRLTDDTAALLSEGPDGVVGTVDDGVIYFSGLATAGQVSAVFMSLGEGAPKPPVNLYSLGDHGVAWIDKGSDRTFGTGDESIKCVHVSHQGAVTTTVPLGTARGGCDEYALPLGDSSLILRFLGGDKILGTPDDELGHLSFSQTAVPSLEIVATGSGINLPFMSQDWPKAISGDAVAYPNSGPDGQLGTLDDALVVVSQINQQPQVALRPVDGSVLWNDWVGPVELGVEPDGTMVLFRMGRDRFFGTVDDGLVFIAPTAGGMDGNEVLIPGAYLAWDREEVMPKSTTLRGGGTLMRSYGPDPELESDYGFMLVSKSSTGRAAAHFPLGGVPKHIVPMGPRAAIFVMDGGEVYHLSGVGTSSPALRLVPGLLFPQGGTPCRISPALMMTTRYDTSTTINRAADYVALWQIQSTFNYGSPSVSTRDFSLHATGEDRVPQLGVPFYFAGLTGAPSNSPAWLLMSWKQSRLAITPAADLLVDPESLFAVFSWVTFMDGSSALPLPVPVDPDLTGMIWNAQWVVLDPAENRGFHLSDGLRLAF